MKHSLRARLGAATAVLLLVPGPALAASWATVRSPNQTVFDNILWGVDATSPNDAWAVGFADTGTTPTRRPVIQRWNGRRWNLVASPLPADGGEMRDVDALSATAGWAVGFQYSDIGTDTLIQRWDGTGWTNVASPSLSAQNYLVGVKSFSANDAWAVGTFNEPGSLDFNTLVERWDGSSWRVVPSPNPGAFENRLNAIDGVSSSDLWAVGTRQDHPDGVRQPLALHFDGVQWTSLPMPVERDASLEAVVALASNDVWAVGWAFSIELFRQVPYALHWNGTAWSRFTLPVPSPEGARLFGITALSPTQVYAVGHSFSQGIPSLAMRYDGTKWTVESTPSPATISNLWDAAAVGPGNLWAVGNSQRINRSAKSFIVRSSNG